MGLKRTVAALRKNKYFLITTHVNPEGDALGAELSLYRLLVLSGKHAVIINQDDLPYGYDFLSGVRAIKKYRDNMKGVRFDCFVILDCSEATRCGSVMRLNKEAKPVINIDHHISNTGFGNINLVDPVASSCSQLIYELYREMKVRMDKDVATLLYIGIMTDTGSFRYSNTTSLTHSIAAKLLKFNIDVARIHKNLYGSIPYEDMKLLADILPTIRLSANGRIAWFQLGRSVLRRKKLCFDLSEHILNFARAIKGVEVAMLFKENLGQENEIRVNFRSTGKVDVNKIAVFFGGGGHRTASGCAVKGDITGVVKKVLKKTQESL